MTLREDDYPPMEQFALAWHFTDEQWNKLPPGAPARIRANTSLSVDLGGVVANCHFFMEVEFDIDPRQVSSEARFSRVYDFMPEIGGLLNKQAILTAESLRSAIIFRYSPEDGQVRHIEAS